MFYLPSIFFFSFFFISYVISFINVPIVYGVLYSFILFITLLAPYFLLFNPYCFFQKERLGIITKPLF